MGVKQDPRETPTKLAGPPASRALEVEVAAASWGTKCLNCGAGLSGHFCAQCGQRAIPPYPTVSELASDAFHEIFGWDGRWANTFRLLLRRPGQLTLDFLNGRRSRHISPIRLYLVCSLAYFVVAAVTPSLRPGSAKTGTVVETGGFRIGVFVPPSADTSAGASGAGRGLTAEERAQALEDLEQSPFWIRPILKAALDDPAHLQAGLIKAMPRALFALLPVFAGILALFYRGRHYPEHLYFAIHLHAFVFLALLMGELANFTHQVAVAATIGIVGLLWIAFYADFALKRVYGGGRLKTLAKGTGIAVLYAIVSIPVLFAMVAWAALT